MSPIVVLKHLHDVQTLLVTRQEPNKVSLYFEKVNNYLYGNSRTLKTPEEEKEFIHPSTYSFRIEVPFSQTPTNVVETNPFEGDLHGE